MQRARPTLSLSLGTALFLAAAARPSAAAAADNIQPFLSRNCTPCHNATVRNADVDLTRYPTPAAILQDAPTWEKAVVKMRTRQMPPPGWPAPDPADVEAVARWIEDAFARADREAPPDPGRVTARRLNRTEYDNTLRDLLGVALDLARDFPQDDAGYGFDNIGDVLSVSPILMEKYVAAAEKAARLALFGPGETKPTLVRHQPLLRGKVRTSPTPLSEYDVTGLSLPNALHVAHRFPVEGEYVVRVVLGGERPAGSEPLPVGLWIDGEPAGLATLDPEGAASFYQDRQDFSGKTREFRVRVGAGERWVAATIPRLFEGLPASYRGPNPSRRPAPPPRVFEPPEDASPEEVEAARKRFEERLKEVAPANAARVAHLQVLGPYAAATGPSPESLRRVLTCGHRDGRHDRGCARRVVGDLARRAYRRPLEGRDVKPLLRLVADARKKGDSFEDAIALAVQAVLVSPDFLFRVERDGKGGPRPVGDHELASRLSYFLWASMPDDELLRAADARRLRRPEVLAAQARRMLRDEKASALAESFAGQWLQFRALESAAPDRERFPDFEDYLRLSMRRETELVFRDLVREDRSIYDLVDGRHSFLNERLARHYGIPGVTGPAFRRVDLAGTPRGGVLTHASVLTVSSYATRTSPVLRGKWILDNLLAAPPPDPPAGTPRLDEATVGTSASLRQQLEAHRASATCAACHSRMDPLGFALENFDAVGAWRTEDASFPIDPSGTLPDGRSFRGPGEMKAILRSDREAFARALTEKLLTYALGRGLERYDRRTVDAIAGRLAGGDDRFSALVLEVVNSLPFRMRRGERTRP